MLRRMGMCCNFGSVLCKKSLNMGTIFHVKIRNFGLWVWFSKWLTPGNFENLMCFCIKIARNGYLFFQKNPKYPIFGKITPEHGYGSWAAGGTSLTNPNLSTPPPQVASPSPSLQTGCHIYILTPNWELHVSYFLCINYIALSSMC